MLRTTRLPRPILLVAACLALSACASATPYQPAEKRDGFWDQKVEENRYLVTFRGNSATPRDIVETYLLFRAAEITLESGHDWFRIAEQDTGLDRRRHGLLEGEVFSKKGKHAHRRHRHRRKFRRRGFVRFGFFGSPFFFGGVHRYSPPPPRYRATANILVFKGEKPSDDPLAYNAAEVIANLGPEIKRPEE